MNTESQPCPVCGGPSAHAFWATDRNRVISRERFEYMRCGRCATVFLPRPPADLARYYEGGYYGFDDDGSPRWRHDPQALEAASYRTSLITTRTAPGRLIEIGPGAGAFAVTATRAGYSVTAIEMDPACCSFLEGEGITAICSDDPVARLHELEPARAIAMWHVLEHLPNPGELLDAAAERLEPGGVLAIGIPNTRSLQFRLTGPSWAHVDAPRHLTLVSPDALVERCRGAGLRLLLATTADPPGREYDRFGWVNSLSRRPGEEPTPWLTWQVANGLWHALGPIERRGLRGTALTAVFGRP